MTKAASAKTRPTKSLARASLEIARVLADRDGVTFRADGTCMYPTIRPGDVLHIQSRKAVDVCLGDIAVCRRPKYLFSHRVIAKDSEEGRAYIATRPDRARNRDDGPTFDENLLGVVVAIKRKGKSVPLQQGNHPWPVRRYFALRLALIETRLRALLWWSSILARLQKTALYRLISRAWLFLARPQISYTVRVPMPGLGDAVYRQMVPETFNVQMDWRGRPVQRWTLTLHLNGAPQPAAWMTFARHAADNWLVEQSFLCARYRGAGLGEMLLSQADAILQRSRNRKQGDQGLEESNKMSRPSIISTH